MRVHGKTTVLGLVLGLAAAGCGEDWLPTTAGMPTSTPQTTDHGSTGPATTSATTSAETGDPSTSADPPTSGATTMAADMGSGGGMCDIWVQDCPNGEKCTAYGPPNSYIPQGIKCVPIPPNAKDHNEPCSVGPEGLGDDNCSLGSVCLDLDYDGSGFCLPYCTGNSDNPICEDDRTCVKLFFGYQFGNCFRQCDPLVQDCAPGEGCYMDATTVGNTGFVCLPVVQEGKDKVFGDGCIGWSSCEPGYACVFEEFVPNCQFGLCCTPWCDISETDPCDKFDPSMDCIPWYNGVQPPPGLENVGICGVPQ